MQRLQKCDERSCFRWAQVLPIRRHVAASLDHLPDELVLREPYGNAVQRRTSLPAAFSKKMAVAALLHLKNERALPLKRSCAAQKSLRHRIAAPGVHVRAPGCEPREMGKCAKRDRDQQHGQDCNRPPPPALFSFAGKKWRSEEHTSELQSRLHLVCRLLLEKKKRSKSEIVSSN